MKKELKKKKTFKGKKSVQNAAETFATKACKLLLFILQFTPWPPADTSADTILTTPQVAEAEQSNH